MPVRSRFPAIIASLKALEPGVESAIGERVKARARERVHVRSGALREAIHLQREDEGTYVVAGDNKAFYGHLEEFGTVRSPAHPFLMPAVEETRSEGVGIAAAILRSRL